VSQRWRPLPQSHLSRTFSFAHESHLLIALDFISQVLLFTAEFNINLHFLASGSQGQAKIILQFKGREVRVVER